MKGKIRFGIVMVGIILLSTLAVWAQQPSLDSTGIGNLGISIAGAGDSGSGGGGGPTNANNVIRKLMINNSKSTPGASAIDANKPPLYMIIDPIQRVSYCLGDCESESDEAVYIPVKVNIWKVNFKNWANVPVETVWAGSCKNGEIKIFQDETKNTDKNGEVRFVFDVKNGLIFGDCLQSLRVFVIATSPKSGRSVYYVNNLW